MAVITKATDSSTLTLNGRVINDTLDGDEFVLAPLNPYATQTGGRRSVSMQSRSDRNVYTLTMRVFRYSDDDTWLNNELNKRFPTVFNGSLKTSLLKDGANIVETWDLANGCFTTQPTDTKNNTDDNLESVYVIQFYTCKRV